MIKLTDLIYCNERKLNGQVMRIRHDLVTIVFVTGDKVEKKLNDIKNVNNQWRING